MASTVRRICSILPANSSFSFTGVAGVKTLPASNAICSNSFDGSASALLLRAITPPKGSSLVQYAPISHLILQRTLLGEIKAKYGIVAFGLRGSHAQV